VAWALNFPPAQEEQRKSVGEFIEFLTGQPGATPQLENFSTFSSSPMQST